MAFISSSIVVLLMVTASAMAQSRALIYHGLVPGYVNAVYARDLSGRGNTGFVSNAIPISTGVVGGALFFDGAGDVVKLPDSILPATADFTLCMWARTSAGVSGSTVLFGQHATAFALYQSTTLGTAAGKLRLAVGAEILIGPDLRDNLWHHICITRSGQVFQLYMDGRPYSSGSTANACTAGLAFLGNRVGQTMWISGTVADVRIYIRALSAEEVRYMWLKTKGWYK